MIPHISRRDFLARTSNGFGLTALAALMGDSAYAGIGSDQSPRTPKLPPRAKNVIFCYMSGGVSHVDTFDPKPALEKFAGKPMPGEVMRTQFNKTTVKAASPLATCCPSWATLPTNSVSFGP
jgi:hypothetical protein